jgi:probable HAF family extracellular repeat protein
MVDLGSFGGPFSEAYAVNDLGEVVGSSQLPISSCPLEPCQPALHAHAFSWTPAAGIVDLGTPAGDGDSYALLVNHDGQVAGNASTAGCGTCPESAWVWSESDGRVSVGSLGGMLSSPIDQNDGGQVVGVADLPDGDLHSFSRAGGTVDMGTLGGNFTYVHAINATGTAAGESLSSDGASHAFAWSQTAGMVDLGCLAADACISSSTAVNDAGAVVGTSIAHGSSGLEDHAYVWTAAGGMVDLGTLGGGNSGATDVNASGEVVGYSDTATAQAHGFLWTQADGMIDLGPVDDPNGLRVNDAGVVSGTVQDRNGEPHATTWQLGTADAGGVAPAHHV